MVRARRARAAAAAASRGNSEESENARSSPPSRYAERAGAADADDAIARAAKRGEFLNNLHAVALSHVLRRPVFIYAAAEDTAAYGVGCGVARRDRPSTARRARARARILGI